MLRALVLALLLANAGFYAWRSGWLAPLHGVIGARPEGEREPQRLERQVNPQAVELLGRTRDAADPGAASSAVGGPSAVEPVAGAASAGAASAGPAELGALAGPAATEGVAQAGACLEAGPFGPSQLAAAEAALQSALPGGGWTVRDLPPGGAWWVASGPYADAEALQRRLDELRRRRIAAEPAAPGVPLLLVLSRHADRAGAEQELAALGGRLRGARVVEGVPQPMRALRVGAADATAQARLAALPPDRLHGRSFVPCTTAAP